MLIIQCSLNTRRNGTRDTCPRIDPDIYNGRRNHGHPSMRHPLSHQFPQIHIRVYYSVMHQSLRDHCFLQLQPFSKEVSLFQVWIKLVVSNKRRLEECRAVLGLPNGLISNLRSGALVLAFSGVTRVKWMCGHPRSINHYPSIYNLLLDPL